MKIKSLCDGPLSKFAFYFHVRRYNTEYGASKGYTCPITTTIYDTQPANLKATQAFFCVFSIVVLIAAYSYDKSKQV